MNVWQELAQEIMQIPVDDPKRGRKIQAMIKRFVHNEKASVYHRLYLCHRRRFTKGERHNEKTKYKNHYRMAKLPDDEVLTWDG